MLRNGVRDCQQARRRGGEVGKASNISCSCSSASSESGEISSFASTAATTGSLLLRDFKTDCKSIGVPGDQVQIILDRVGYRSEEENVAVNDLREKVESQKVHTIVANLVAGFTQYLRLASLDEAQRGMKPYVSTWKIRTRF
jgi:hypothetical protein